jgi:hypothetical protein
MRNIKKRKRGFRLLSPRSRFGLVWPIRRAIVNSYSMERGQPCPPDEGQSSDYSVVTRKLKPLHELI